METERDGSAALAKAPPLVGQIVNSTSCWTVFSPLVLDLRNTDLIPVYLVLSTLRTKLPSEPDRVIWVSSMTWMSERLGTISS